MSILRQIVKDLMESDDPEIKKILEILDKEYGIKPKRKIKEKYKIDGLIKNTRKIY